MLPPLPGREPVSRGVLPPRYLVKYSLMMCGVDNLYLDLNGIVHNCIHGNDAKLHERVSKLVDFDEVWTNIMKAIDEIVHTVKP
jgi:5'-3' exonuclease